MSQATQHPASTVNVPPLRYLSEKAVSEMTGIPCSTLQKDRHYRRGIAYSKFGKTVRYSLADICAFMNGCKVNPDAQ